MLFSRFARITASLAKPVRSASLLPRASFALSTSPAPPVFRLLRRSLATSSPSNPSSSNLTPNIHQSMAPTSNGFMRSSVFWGDTKPGSQQLLICICSHCIIPLNARPHLRRHHGKNPLVGQRSGGRRHHAKVPSIAVSVARCMNGCDNSSRHPQLSVPGFMRFCDYFGTWVFAISGTLTAATSGLDLLGCVVVGSITALGGGTARDMIMGQVLTLPTVVQILLKLPLISG
jgi:hypothetical protein